MRLTTLVLCSLVLATHGLLASAHFRRRQGNFSVAYTLSSTSEKTGFGKVLAGVVGSDREHVRCMFTAARSSPIEAQMTSLVIETVVNLPFSARNSLLRIVKHTLKMGVPEFEKHHKNITVQLRQKLQMDLRRLMQEKQKTIDILRAFHYSSQGIEKYHAGILLNFCNKYPINSSLVSEEIDLKDIILGVIDMFEQMVKLSQFRRHTCIFARKVDVVTLLELSKEKILHNLAATHMFVMRTTLKMAIDSFQQSNVTQNLMKHFRKVFSTADIDKLEDIWKKYGVALMSQKISLIMALLYRPKGTFQSGTDFAPYFSIWRRAGREAPLQFKKMFTLMDPSNIGNISPSRLKSMFSGNPEKYEAICNSTFHNITAASARKLNQIKGYKRDLSTYCHFQGLVEAHLMNMSNYFNLGIDMIARMIGLKDEEVKIIKATFAPGSIPPISTYSDNPRACYKSLRSCRKAKLLLKAVKEETFSKNVCRRTEKLINVMFGADPCSSE